MRALVLCYLLMQVLDDTTDKMLIKADKWSIDGDAYLLLIFSHTDKSDGLHVDAFPSEWGTICKG